MSVCHVLQHRQELHCVVRLEEEHTITVLVSELSSFLVCGFISNALLGS